MYSASGIGKAPPTPIEKWAEADFLFRRMKEDGRLTKRPTGNTHEISIGFIWMADTPVPIKEEPETPPKRAKKGSKRIRPVDSSPEVPRPMTTRRQAKIGRVEEDAKFDVLDDIEDFKSLTDIIRGEDTEGKAEGKEKGKVN